MFLFVFYFKRNTAVNKFKIVDKYALFEFKKNLKIKNCG